MKLNYDLKNLKGDIVGGVTVAIVALPLAIAFGISSMPNDPNGAMAGLYGAVFTGIFATVFGSTGGLINGPTAAMIVVLASAYAETGVSGFFLAMLLASLMQIAMGLLKLGKYVHFIPQPVITGFTNGIGVTIFISKFSDFKTNPAIALIVIGIMFIPIAASWLPKNAGAGRVSAFFKIVPASLVALFAAVLAVHYAFPDAAHIQGIPGGLPALRLPVLWGVDYAAVVKNAFILCLLASIESLLSSVVVDDMLDKRSDPNRELVGQGIGNGISALMGGLMGTGALIRSAVNVGSGGRTKLSGVIHAVIIFLVVVKFGYLAETIPIAALAGILMVTAFRMIEFESVKMLGNVPKSDAFVMVVTMLITIFHDLMAAVLVGTSLSAILFAFKMSRHSQIPVRLRECQIQIITVPGPLFFGCVRDITHNLRMSKGKTVILNMSRATIIDETAVKAIFDLRRKMQKSGRSLVLTRLTPSAAATIARMYPNADTADFIFEDSSEAVAYAEGLCV